MCRHVNGGVSLLARARGLIIRISGCPRLLLAFVRVVHFSSEAALAVQLNAPVIGGGLSAWAKISRDFSFFSLLALCSLPSIELERDLRGSGVCRR